MKALKTHQSTWDLIRYILNSTSKQKGARNYWFIYDLEHFLKFSYMHKIILLDSGVSFCAILVSYLGLKLNPSESCIWIKSSQPLLT